MIDSFGRGIDYMRVSITDRCNLRCVYCMPYDLPDIPHGDILKYEEILRICGIMSRLGVKTIRVTGGEPLVRKGCAGFIRELKEIPGIENVSITTNGLLFTKYADELIEAGISGVNFSLDTLDKDTYLKITGSDGLRLAMQAIETAAFHKAGLRVKINTVPARGLNEGCIEEVARLAERLPADVRFIELMPKGFGAGFERISSDEIYEKLAGIWPDLSPDEARHGFGPAKYYKSAGLKGSIGLISALSEHFCGRCNRIRLTSDGFLKLCLYHADGIDLRGILRGGASDEQIAAAISEAVGRKPEKHFFNDVDSFEANGSQEGMSKIGG